MAKKAYRVRNWKDYNKSLVQRGSLTFWFSKEERRKLWKQENKYHRRSLIEAMMFRMKAVFGDQMRSRTLENQRTDLLIRCYAMNKINSLGLPVSEAI